MDPVTVSIIAGTAATIQSLLSIAEQQAKLNAAAAVSLQATINALKEAQAQLQVQTDSIYEQIKAL